MKSREPEGKKASRLQGGLLPKSLRYALLRCPVELLRYERRVGGRVAYPQKQVAASHQVLSNTVSFLVLALNQGSQFA